MRSDSFMLEVMREAFSDGNPKAGCFLSYTAFEKRSLMSGTLQSELLGLLQSCVACEESTRWMPDLAAVIERECEDPYILSNVLSTSAFNSCRITRLSHESRPVISRLLSEGSNVLSLYDDAAKRYAAGLIQNAREDIARRQQELERDLQLLDALEAKVNGGNVSGAAAGSGSGAN